MWVWCSVPPPPKKKILLKGLPLEKILILINGALPVISSLIFDEKTKEKCAYL